MKIKNIFAYSLTVIMLGSCNVYTNISTSTDISADFTKYKTFAWLPDQIDTNNITYPNTIIRNNIRNYFGKSFAERGYAVNLEAPDLLLGISVTSKKQETPSLTSPYPQPYYYCRYYYGSIYYLPYEFSYYYRYPAICYPINYYSQKQVYFENTITLNVFDRKTNKLIWSGTAKGNIYDPSYLSQSIHPAVRAIMSRYPVKPLID